ncbi:MAG TPA: acylphosphatase [Dehalococcoidia bacterium]|nr:acylphosphatase [Dehalococcoidia bacterium]
MTEIRRASLHAVVHGRVQDVGFREFVRRRANTLLETKSAIDANSEPAAKLPP